MLRSSLRKFQSKCFKPKNKRTIQYAKNINEVGKWVESFGICNLSSKNLDDQEEFLESVNQVSSFIKKFNIDNYEKFSIHKFININEIKKFSRTEKNSVCINRNTDYYYSSKEEQFLPIDNNMYDFFEPQYLDESIKRLLELFKSKYLNSFIKTLNKSFKKEFYFSHSSLYCYRGNNMPRWIHYDSFKSHIKFFIALNDIDHINFGPYCYVIKSNKNNLLKFLNTFINIIFSSDVGSHKADGTLLSRIFATPAFLKKGDILISDNSGFHGDLPSLNNDLQKNLIVLNLHFK